MTDKAFDPLSYENLGASISRALDEQPLTRLDQVESFAGAGVYALYYVGNFPAYTELAMRNRQHPGSWAIYIGKAEAQSNRKGDPNQQQTTLDGPKLFLRLRNHRKSIEQAENLNVEDFYVRSLVVAPTWVSLAESIAIRLHKPLWNSLVDGLGNHDPGAGRRQGKRPLWDTVHPGRSWALSLESNPTSPANLERRIRDYLTQQSNT